MKLQRKKLDSGFTSLLAFTTLLCLLPILLSLAFYEHLPERIVIHWGFEGEPNGDAAKDVVCFLFPIGMALANAAVLTYMQRDPRKENIPQPLLALVQWLLPILTLFLMVYTLFYSLGIALFRVEVVIPALIGVLLAVIGNYLPKCKQNNVIGVRLPWTLLSKENWRRTHRVTGFVWTAGGLAMIASSLLGAHWIVFWTLLLGFVILFPSLYSFILHRKGI